MQCHSDRDLQMSMYPCSDMAAIPMHDMAWWAPYYIPILQQPHNYTADKPSHDATVSDFIPSDPKKPKRKRRGQRKHMAGDVNIAAQETTDDAAAGFVNMDGDSITCLGQNSDRCSRINEQLEGKDSDLLQRLIPDIWHLARQRHGTRVAQKIVELASPCQHAEIIKELMRGHAEKTSGPDGVIVDLYKSPHGNHVVTKLIEVLPTDSLQFILDELTGRALDAARHQYGCRVLERLIEHCKAEQVSGLIDELMIEAEPLCRHQFGNFVIQHIFEHGQPVWKTQLMKQIVAKIPELSKHRTASHVVQKAIASGQKEVQDEIVMALLKRKGTLVGLSCERYGMYVVEELASLGDHYSEVRQALQEGLECLLRPPAGLTLTAGSHEESKGYGARIAARFGLQLPMP
jgi:hypothetical protein